MRSVKRRPFSHYRLVLAFSLIALGLLSACASDDTPDRVHVLTWDDAVNPVMARYIDRGIDAAEDAQARAVVLKLDTPGGLDSAMREIVQRIEASRVPVIVWVAPSGSRAASAGTFITMAGHVAAMAPGTTIGAATPISSGGGDIEGTLGRKVTNDAVAYIRGIAELRERNADWAEKAVRDAVAVNANEAVSLDVVDFVAGGLDELLTQADGRSVKVATMTGATQTVTLATRGAATTDDAPNLFERALNVLANPDIAFLLLSLGGLAIVAEIYTQSGVTGIFGVIALVLAFFSLGALPTNWAGVGLIALGFTLLAAEIFVAGFGVLGIAGLVSLVVGGLILFGSSPTSVEVSRWLVIGLAAFVGVVLVFFVGAIVKMRRMPAHSGRESLVGAKGTTRTRLNPRGVVLVDGERWDAIADDPPIEDDTPILVTASEGLKLHVKLDPAYVKLLPAGDQPTGTTA